MYYTIEVLKGEKMKVRVSDQLQKETNLIPVDFNDISLLGYIDENGGFTEKEAYEGWTLLPSKFEGFDNISDPLGVLRKTDIHLE